MPKYRKLHLKTTESLDINDMPDDFTRLLWVLLPLGLDAAGRGLDNPSWIKAKVMPLREDVTPEMIVEAFDWYTNRRMIIRYEVEGRLYFYVPTWKTYQGDTSREAPSNYPAFGDDNSGVTQELLKSNSTYNEYESVFVYESESEQESVKQLQTAFINASGIAAFGMADLEVYQQLSKQGVTPAIIVDAVNTLQAKKYTIKSIKSIVTTAVNILKQGQANPTSKNGKPIVQNEDGSLYV